MRFARHAPGRFSLRSAVLLSPWPSVCSRWSPCEPCFLASPCTPHRRHASLWHRTPTGEETIMSAAFDLTSRFAKGLPDPSPRFGGFPKYNFVGGHNDPERDSDRGSDRGHRIGAAARRLEAGDVQPGAGTAGLHRLARVRRRQAEPPSRHEDRPRRRADHHRLRPGHRHDQPDVRRARRHRDPRGVLLRRRDQPLQARRRQHHRHSAR